MNDPFWSILSSSNSIKQPRNIAGKRDATPMREFTVLGIWLLKLGEAYNVKI